MASICFTTVCTGNHYGFFVPMFVYSTKVAYPDAGVRVFIKGKIKPTVASCLEMIKYDGWEVKENCFMNYPRLPSITNSLRFLVGQEEFGSYDYIMIRDVDFVNFSHEVSHLDYFSKRMKNSCYYGVRGPYNFPRRHSINKIGWKDHFTRIAGGTVLVKNPEWFEKTHKSVKKYRHNLKAEKHDKYDKHVPASYREYDEVMLYRICKESNLKTPRIKNKDLHGHHISNVYRDIHLGDFFKTPKRPKRFKRVVAKENAQKFIELWSDPIWQEMTKKLSKNDKIATVLKRARRHLKNF
jgi:hypothetical protein